VLTLKVMACQLSPRSTGAAAHDGVETALAISAWV